MYPNKTSIPIGYGYEYNFTTSHGMVTGMDINFENEYRCGYG